MLTALLSTFAATCSPGTTFFGLPVWYKYLMPDKFSTSCELTNNFNFPQDVSLIALAAVDILLRVAGLVAVGYVIYGGVQFITAQGEPEKNKKARETIINSMIGLILALIAVGIVNFIGSKF